MRYIFLIALIATNSYAQSKSELIDILTKKAKADVSALLKDPDSAKFRNLKLVDPTVLSEKGIDVFAVICGEVNGKNTYGGYSGFVPFLYDGSPLIYNENDEIDAKSFEDTYNKKCKDGTITKIKPN
jgi:hypothetical protein